MKIAINGKFLSAAPTGVHRVAAELANALAELRAERHEAVEGLDISLWLPRDGSERAAEIRQPQKLVRPLTGIPWEQLTLPLVQSDHLLLSLCNIGPALTRNAITMIHDVQVHLSPASYRRAFRLWYHFIQPAFARRHRHILTVSEYSRGQIVSAGLCAADRISVIHNGVDHILRELPDREAIGRLQLERHGYVAALATTQAHKNIALLLKAFADPSLARLKLVLIGSGGRHDFLDRGVDVPPNVLFTGRISDAALRGLLEEALCIAFPSTTEGFGLPPLEAMLLGCPAIVAPCGALPEVCGDAAVYAAPNSSQAWVRAILNFGESPETRAKWAGAGRKQAARFTWRSAAATLGNVLKNHA